MEEKPKRWWQGITLRYLLFETALWAMVCGITLVKATVKVSREYLGFEFGLLVTLTLVGAAVGGLIRRPGVGAFVGGGIGAYIMLLNAIYPTID